MRVALPVLAVVVCCCVTARAADSPPRPALETDSLPPIFAPRPPAKKAPARRGAPQTTPTRRAISPEMAAKLSSALTRADPVPTTAAGAPTGFTSAERTETDAVQLEPYIVEEEKFPEFKERHLLTPKGKLDLAYKRHPGLNLGPIPLFNQIAAQELIEDDFQKERRQEMMDLFGVLRAGETQSSGGMKRTINETRLRTNERAHQVGTPFREPR